MRTPWQFLLVLTTLVLTACAQASDPSQVSTSPATVEIAVRDGSVVTETEPLTVRMGTTVVIKVSADVADEVHVHGYDVTAKTSPGNTATAKFTADIPGQFDIELEESHLALLELRVQ